MASVRRRELTAPFRVAASSGTAQRLEDVPVVQVGQEVPARLQVQRCARYTPREFARPRRVEELVIGARPYVHRHSDVLGREAPRAHHGAVFLDYALRLPQRLA